MNFSARITGRMLIVAVVAAVAASVGAAIWSLVRNNTAEIASFHWSSLLIVLILCCMYRMGNAHGWWLVLRAVNQRLAPRTTLQLWLSSEACRWLPGSAWNFGSRALLVCAGIRPSAAAASLVLELALTLAAWLTVALLCIPFCNYAVLQNFPFTFSVFEHIEAIAVAGIAFVLICKCAWPWLRSTVGSKLSHFSGSLKTLSLCRPDPSWGIGAYLYYVCMASVQGMALFCLIRLTDDTATVPIWAVVGVNAVAWLLGFFAFAAPGGLVVREGSLTVLLSAWIAPERALAYAIVWRLLQIAAELACAVIVFTPTLLAQARRTSAALRGYSSHPPS